jgi:hypothetical protein
MKGIFSVTLLTLLMFFSSCKANNNDILKQKWSYVSNSSSGWHSGNGDSVLTIVNGKANFYTQYNNKITHIEEAVNIFDSVMIIPKENLVNGTLVCCETDTFTYYVDTVSEKTFLFLISKRGNYALSLQLMTEANVNPKPRKEIKFPFYNYHIGQILSSTDYRDSVEMPDQISSYKTFYQLSTKDPSVRFSTFKIGDKGERLIASLVKKKLGEANAKNTLDYLYKRFGKQNVKHEYDTVALLPKEIYLVEHSGVQISLTKEKVLDMDMSKYTLDDFALKYIDEWNLEYTDNYLLTRYINRYHLNENAYVSDFDTDITPSSR